MHRHRQRVVGLVQGAGLDHVDGSAPVLQLVWELELQWAVQPEDQGLLDEQHQDQGEALGWPGQPGRIGPERDWHVNQQLAGPVERGEVWPALPARGVGGGHGQGTQRRQKNYQREGSRATASSPAAACRPGVPVARPGGPAGMV